MTPVVDIHCHNFNADDLPVRGFLERVAFHDVDLARDLAALVDVLIQGGAPGYLEELRTLDSILASSAAPGEGPESWVPGAVGISSPAPDLEAMADLDFAHLAASEPALLRRIGNEMPAAGGGAQPPGVTEGPEGLGDWIERAKRAIKWVRIFGMSRLDVTRRLVRTFGVDEVDLFTPMLVDLGMGLYDSAGTTVRQQIELQEKISRLSMIGKLEGTTRSRVHPFIGFDPRREMLARVNGDVETPLDLVVTAVEKYGFIGVKLYPPMGFKPIDNTRTVDMTTQEALVVEGILHEFYAWCEKEQVPVTAHCAASNGAHSTYRFFSDPSSWGKVLERYPGLHLNLGHFGGTPGAAGEDSWPRRIAQLMTRDERHLYADVGNHRLDDERAATDYLRTVKSMADAGGPPGVRERLMYGSDWYMLAAHPQHEQFLTRYRELHRQVFGDAAVTEQFLGGAALTFLFGPEHGDFKNRLRLLKRYEAYAPDDIPGWLRAGEPSTPPEPGL